jgi:TRAP-type C4-dicarboxylate transport system substrate-binding protein
VKKIARVLFSAFCAFALLFAVSGFIPAADAAPEITLRLAGQNPIEHQATQAMYEIAKEVKEKTKGRIEIKVFPASQLGDYVLLYEELIRGDLDMALISVPSQFDPRLELPYVNGYIRNYNQVKEVYKPTGWLSKKMDEFHSRLGVKFLGFNVEGMGGIGTTKPVTDPTNPKVDKGILLRVCSIDAFKLAAEDVGYRTVTIPYAELYTALQTGVAGGVNGLPPVACYTILKDVLKYYYQTNYFVESESYLMSKKVWESLKPADREIIAKAAARQAASSIISSQKDDQKYMDLMKKAGIKVYTYTDKELDPLFKQIAAVTWDKMAVRMGKDLMDEFKKQYAR